ncbi:Hsp20/alpha crystallin family protein [Dokdonella sp.]|uniref:Hsp20/alpha crystallin family protein n=1 Tax=Dokdonella sp. TaxID=2291710 RepID=UPI0031C3204C|nr:Hsp20/alpha crystallin family protein [Dokdonella sp.]
MSVTQLIPWTRNRNSLVRSGNRDPFFALQREVNRLFDDMWSGLDMPMLRGRLGERTGWPTLDLSERDKEFVLTVEVPGMDEKDVDVQFANGTLIVRGERKEERTEAQGEAHYSERMHGRFERQIPLDVDIDLTRAKATLKNGLLTVTLPKAAQTATETHRIAVSRAA